MSFKNIGNLLTANKKGTGLIDALKAFGDVSVAGDALRELGGDMDDSTKRLDLLRQAFPQASDAALDAAAGIDAMGSSMSAATKQTSGLGSAIKGAFSVDPIGSTITAVTAVIGIASTIYNAVKQYNEELTKQAQEAGSEWTESLSSMDEYATKYAELKSQLESGELSESETLSVKQQILDIQNQIVDTYGSQASGIDLVNGELDAQLAKMQAITQQSAQSDWNENSKAYNHAYDQIASDFNKLISGGGSPGTTTLIDGEGVYKDVMKIVDGFDELSVYQDAFTGLNNLSLNTDDVIEAQDVLNAFITDLNYLQKQYAGDDAATSYIQGVISDATKIFNQASDIFESNKDGFYGGLSSELNAYYDTGKEALDSYTEAVEKYNEVLHSDDVSRGEIEEARKAYEDATIAKDEFLNTEGTAKFAYLFDQVGDQLDDAALRFYDIQEILNKGIVTDGNQFSEYADDIEAAANRIEKLGLDVADVESAISTDGIQ